ncbi:hypothetical protein SAMN04489764_4291 [Thermostaphylospora chromogena]|uniref:Uncharacterized protein n=1 Tax=Thermostaphylospora chromogena TaxID=35622 RepID=A0A1H1HCV2_9ACTN|nr:hypothetical protein SAMN04489764_4291 [Thermostaphylospora chromogena]
MRRRVPVWGGAGVAVAALVVLGVYLYRVGLDKADKLASVIGLFVALIGLGVTVYGLVAERRSGGGAPRQAGTRDDAAGATSGAAGGARPIQQQAEAVEDGEVLQAGGVINDGRRSEADRPEAGKDDAKTSDATGGARPIQQQAKAAGRGRVYQAGGDIHLR